VCRYVYVVVVAVAVVVCAFVSCRACDLRGRTPICPRRGCIIFCAARQSSPRRFLPKENPAHGRVLGACLS